MNTMLNLQLHKLKLKEAQINKESNAAYENSDVEMRHLLEREYHLLLEYNAIIHQRINLLNSRRES